MKTPKKSLFIG